MCSESTVAFGQPSETKPTLGILDIGLSKYERRALYRCRNGYAFKEAKIAGGCVCCWGFSPLQPRRTPCGCCTAASHFSCLARKSNQKNSPPACRQFCGCPRMLGDTQGNGWNSQVPPFMVRLAVLACFATLGIKEVTDVAPDYPASSPGMYGVLPSALCWAYSRLPQ